MAQTKAQLIDGKGDAAFDTNTLFIDSTNNRVGIGTSGPVNVLELAGNNSAGNGIGNVQGILRVNNNTTAFGSSPTAGIVFATKYRSSPDIPLDGAAIYGGKENTSDANKSFFLAFATRAESGNNGNEAMRIDSSGRVGIGTTSPGTLLELKQLTGDTELRLYSNTGYVSRIGAVGSDTLAFSTGFTERARIDSSGRLLVGTSTVPSAASFGSAFAPDATGGALYNSRNATSGTNHCLFYNPNGLVGRIQTSGTSTSYLTTSDYRLKENVTPVPDGITRLQQLKPSRFNFIADPDTVVDGFIAHEVQDIVPEAIAGEKDAVDDEGNPEYQGIDQSKLVPLLTAALQEAIGEIESLKARVAALEAS